MNQASLFAPPITPFGLKATGGNPQARCKQETPCLVCGTLKPKKYKTCSRHCSRIYCARIRSPEQEQQRREKISRRMKIVRTLIPNPVERLEVREKISATHKSRGITFKTRGGNGHGPTYCEQMLYQELIRLRPTWLWRLGYADANGQRKPGIPSHYKIDIAVPIMKIAIEVDGSSHRNPVGRSRDAKKTAILNSRGWLVLRCLNEEVRLDVKAMAAKILASIPSQWNPALTLQMEF